MEVEESKKVEDVKPIEKKEEKKSLFGKKKKEVNLNLEKPIDVPIEKTIETPPIEPLFKPIENIEESIPIKESPIKESPIQETKMDIEQPKFIQEEVLPPEPPQPKEVVKPIKIEKEPQNIKPQQPINTTQPTNIPANNTFDTSQFGNMFAPRVNTQTQPEVQPQKKDCLVKRLKKQFLNK